MQPGHDRITIREDGSDLVRWEFAEDGVPIDWTGWTARAQVRSGTTRTDDLLADLSTSNSLITMGADGSIELDFTAAIVAAIPNGTHRGDLRVVSPDSRPDYPMTFTLEIVASLTAPA